MRVRGLILGTVLLAFLVGCSSNSGTLSAPTMEVEQRVHDNAVSSILEKIEVADGQLCPINDRGELLVFCGKAVGPKDGSRIVINGVAIEPGQRFETRSHIPIKEGFTCGGELYENAVHVATKELTVFPNE